MQVFAIFFTSALSTWIAMRMTGERICKDRLQPCVTIRRPTLDNTLSPDGKSP